MNIALVIIILISLSATFINAEEEAIEESRHAQDDYSSVELASPRNSDVTQEEKSAPDRFDGIVDLDDVIKSSEFNHMFYPETTQVRRFAAPLKDNTNDDLFKTAKLNIRSKDATNEKDRNAKEERKSAKEMLKSAKKEDKSAKKEEKSGMRDDRTGKEKDKSAKEEDKGGEEMSKTGAEKDKSGEEKDKSGHDEDKSGHERDKSGNEQDKNGEEQDKSGIEKDKSASAMEDKAGSPEILSIKASRNDELPQEKTEENTKRSLSRVDEFPDDMDDLIYPYNILDKFRKSFDDENDDKSLERYDDDVAFDGSANTNVYPNRRMFESPPIPSFQNKALKEKIEMPQPNFNAFTPKPFIGTGIRQNPNTLPAQMFQPTMKPPLPYVNDVNPYFPPNLRIPPNARFQNPRLNNFQQLPQPRQNINRWNQPQEPLVQPLDRKIIDHDSNEYPLAIPIPPPMLRNINPQNNPIFRKLTQASIYPQPVIQPGLRDVKFPVRPGNAPYRIQHRVYIRPNYNPLSNPYLLRNKRFNIM